MATIELQRINQTDGVITRFLWEAMNGTDVGQGLRLKDYKDNTVTVTGTFDSNTLTMQGSNDNINWFTVTSLAGLDVTFAAVEGISSIAEAPTYIRPFLGAGASSDIDVRIQLG